VILTSTPSPGDYLRAGSFAVRHAVGLWVCKNGIDRRAGKSIIQMLRAFSFDDLELTTVKYGQSKAPLHWISLYSGDQCVEMNEDREAYCRRQLRILRAVPRVRRLYIYVGLHIGYRSQIRMDHCLKGQ